MMSHKAEENKYERPQAYANSGLESLAAEASRRAESMDADLDARGNNNDNTENEPKSPTRSSGPRGKVRKAYTITKQRERWTEEEHDRFLQALKRYGRAWRKIEEHIGTKTAVQIRSHAQKFFSKLQREQSMNGGKDESSKNDISIPPPRPKRKPMHPYPRNSVDNSSEARGDQGRQIRHQAPESQHRKDSGATTSTQVPTSNNQYSNSSGYQSGQPGAPNHFPLFHSQPSPFAGLSMAQQPSQVQLPPFPTLDTSSGENMTKVLKDAAMAAASAWNQVIAGASQKIQHQIQAQSYNPGIQSAPSLPMWNMSQQYPEQTEQNPFMRQLLSQLAAQQAANQQFVHGSALSTHGPALFPASTAPVTSSLDARNTAFSLSQSQRYKQLFEGPGRNEGPDSDRDSLGSEEGTKASKSAFNTNIQGGLAYWSKKQPYTAAEAKLGRTAWEMMNRVTAQKSREAAKQEEAQNTSLMKAPSPGASGGSRRIMKPVPHSARISPLHDLNSGIQSAVHSDTSQLAHYYQRAAAAERDSRSPENYGNGSSANGDNGSSGDLENGFAGNNRKSDKGSNNGTGSDDANGNIVKDQGSNGSNEGASPKMKDLKVSTLDKANKSSNDDLASNFVAPTKGNLPGSDKGSHNGSGSGSDEDGQANGSDLAAAGGEEKGSNEGSNDGQQSPRESSPVKNGSRSASKPAKRPQNEENFVHANNPHSAEANWAAASFHNQQQACQEALKQGRPTQADMVQQILPFTLTPQQHQAISTWAAANSQSQPHQYRLMQSLLNGLTNPSSEYPAMAGNGLMDRQISGLTSADTGSNTECNTAAVLGRGGLGLDSRASAPAGDHHKPGMDLPKRPSGFQPYSSKRPADSTISAPAPKRFAGGNSLSDHPESRLGDSPRSGPTPQSQDPRSACKRDAYTPFGAQSIQSGQVHS